MGTLEKCKAPGKAWYKSKELWTEFIGSVCLFVQYRFGWVVPPNMQVGALMLILAILRWKTKEPIHWEMPKLKGGNVKKIGLLLLCVIMLCCVGCKTMGNLCKHLQGDVRMADKIIVKARTAHMNDPNHITSSDIKALEKFRDDLMIRASTACMLDQIIPLD